MRYLSKIKTSLNSPIRKNILANMFGIGVNLLNQIVLVPFFLIYWGTAKYSDWIVISSLSSFFFLTDVGLNSVVQNRFVIEYAKKEYKECNSLLICNLVIITTVLIICLTLTIVFLSIYDINNTLKLAYFSNSESSKVFLFLLVSVFLYMYCGVPNAIFKAEQKNYIAVIIDQLCKFAVFVVTLICIICNIDIVIMAILMNVPIIVISIFKFNMALKLFEFKCNFGGLSVKYITNILGQGLGYLSFPIANAIIIQGFTLVVNNFFGSSSVVLYNTTRTMCNFLKTLLGTILNSVWPEFSLAYGRKDVTRMKYLYYKSVRVSIIVGLLICLGILIFGPYIYKLWTHGEVIFNYKLMIAFLIVLMVNTIWNTGCVVLLSTNNHIKFGFINVLLSAFSLVVSTFVARYTDSLPCIVYSSLISEILLMFYVFRRFNLMMKQFSYL